jgi:hypothetical protein
MDQHADRLHVEARPLSQLLLSQTLGGESCGPAAHRLNGGRQRGLRARGRLRRANLVDCNLVPATAPCTYTGANRPTDLGIEQVVIHEAPGSSTRWSLPGADRRGRGPQRFGGWDAQEAIVACGRPALYIQGAVLADINLLRRLCPEVAVGATVESGQWVQLEAPDQVKRYDRPLPPGRSSDRREEGVAHTRSSRASETGATWGVSHRL